VRVLKLGYRLDFDTLPPLILPPAMDTCSTSREKLAILRPALQELLDKRVVEVCENLSEPGWYSRIFPVAKRDPTKHRIILDLHLTSNWPGSLQGAQGEP
jgi:hypothetical protein